MADAKVNYLWLVVVVWYVCGGNSKLVLACDGNCPGQAQIDWLISMQNPNTGLVESYEGNEDNFAYIFDQALVQCPL